MLISFADLVMKSPQQWTRPMLTKASNNDDIIAVKAGTHPIIATLQHGPAANAFVPNDCFLGQLENMQIITGCNGSGKSVYIKQVNWILFSSVWSTKCNRDRETLTSAIVSIWYWHFFHSVLQLRFRLHSSAFVLKSDVLCQQDKRLLQFEIACYRD